MPFTIKRYTNKKLKYFCCAFLLLFSAQVFSQKKLPNFYDKIPNEKLAAQIIEEMNDEELLAQVLMFSWKRESPDERIIDWVKNSGLGSIKLFGWNTGNTKLLAESIFRLQKKALQSRFSIPLFVATDQEGGWVRHVKGETSETPGNMALGASGLASDAFYEAYYICKELKALGINLNFAPAVDLLSEHRSTIISTRAFSDNPETAGLLGISFMKGCQAAGLLSTAKHFPGHGGTSIDSHGRIPEINIDKAVFEKRELLPFKKLIDAGIPAIMTGHLNFPQIQKSKEPATFSEYIIKDLLRKKLGFKGLVITDDIMMTGALNFAGSLEAAVRLALLAGNNIVESSKTPKKTEAVWRENLAHLKTNPKFRQCVKDSAYKILLTKLKYFKGKNRVPIFPDIKKISNQIPNKNGQAYFLNLACRATTIVRKKNIPFMPSPNEKILLASDYDFFLDAGLKRFPFAKRINLNSAIRFTRNFDTIIFCLSNDNSLKILKRIIKNYPYKNIIVISVLSPVLLNEVPEIKTAIAAYSYSPASITAAFAALCGDFIPKGKMPIEGIR